MDVKEQHNIEKLSKLLRSRSIEQVVLETMLVLVIEITALVGNCVVCYVFYKIPRLRTVTNVYVGALAISDVLMAALVMPWTIGILIKGTGLSLLSSLILNYDSNHQSYHQYHL